MIGSYRLASVFFCIEKWLLEEPLLNKKNVYAHFSHCSVHWESALKQMVKQSNYSLSVWLSLCDYQCGALVRKNGYIKWWWIPRIATITRRWRRRFSSKIETKTKKNSSEIWFVSFYYILHIYVVHDYCSWIWQLSCLSLCWCCCFFSSKFLLNQQKYMLAAGCANPNNTNVLHAIQYNFCLFFA